MKISKDLVLGNSNFFPVTKSITYPEGLGYSENWQKIFGMSAVSPKEALSYAERIDNSEVWQIVLGRNDVQEYLTSFPLKESGTCVEEVGNWKFWEKILETNDAQECLNN